MSFLYAKSYFQVVTVYMKNIYIYIYIKKFLRSRQKIF